MELLADRHELDTLDALLARAALAVRLGVAALLLAAAMSVVRDVPAMAQSGSPGVEVGVGGTPTPARIGPRVLTTNGYGAGVAIGEDGTTHVAWNEPRADLFDAVSYCGVPRPGSACTNPQTFTPAGTVPEGRYDTLSPAPVYVLTPRPDEVVIITWRMRAGPLGGLDVSSTGRIGACSEQDPCHQVLWPVFAYVSHDGGATFQERVIGEAIGGVAAVGTLTVDVGTPDERDLILLFEGQESELVVTSTRTFATACTQLAGAPTIGDQDPGEAALGVRGQDVLLAFHQADTIFTRRVRATPGASGEQIRSRLCDAGNWGPWQKVPGANSTARLASGERRSFMLSRRLSGTRGEWVARDVTRRNRGRATELGRAGTGPQVDTFADADIAMDGVGELAATWVEPTAAGHTLRFARSRDTRQLLAPTTLLNLDRSRVADTERVRLASLEDGGGAIVYQHGRAAGATRPRSLSLLLFGTRTPRPVDDVHVAGAEITQGVQAEAPLQRSPANPAASLAYRNPGDRSARLVQGKPTVVRAYVTVRRALAAGGTPPPVQMRVLRDGAPVQTLLPTPPSNAPPAAGAPFGPPVGDAFNVPADVHRAVGREYTFVVPPIDDFASYSFQIEANPAGALPAYPECRRCRGVDNFLRLGPQRFFRPTTVNLMPIEMAVGPDANHRVRGAATGPGTVFASTRTMLPVGLNIPPFQGFYNISGQAKADDSPEDRQGDALDLVEEWADDTDNDRSGLFPIGLYPFDARGFGFPVPGMDAGSGYWLRGGKTGNAEYLDPVSCWVDDCVQALYRDRQPLAVLGDSPGRDVIETAHEIVHGLGFKHAGSDRTCYEEESQIGESWPYGNDGKIDGIGLDTRGGTPPFARVVSDFAARETTVYDMMSYCGPAFGRPAWLSLYNWNRISGYFAPAQAASARTHRVASATAAQAVGRSLAVSATVPHAGAGARIVRVRPDDHPPVARAAVARQGPYSVVARDSAGAVLFEAAVERRTDEEGGDVDSLRAFVPSDGVDRVDVIRVSDGAVLAQRSASKSAPAVRIIAPRRRATIGRRGRVALRWRARDADGDRLETWIEYAANGRRFRTIGYQAGGARLRLPARLFRRAPRARVRVRVSDGFHERSATVGPIRSLGAPPQIDVLAPQPRTRGRADSSIALHAIAYDDAGRRLPDRALRWKRGRRVLVARGTGSALIGAGRVRLRVVARDRRGRISRRTVRVRVAGAQPRFIRLTGPARVRPRARRVRLRVASAFPSVLRAQGRRLEVGRSPRRVVMRLPRRGAEVRIPLVLRSGGHSQRATVVVVRKRADGR